MSFRLFQIQRKQSQRNATISVSMTTIASADLYTDDTSNGTSDKVAKVIAEARTKKPLAPETPQHAWRRRLIISSLWAIVLLVGLPTWYHTTAVHRANLPLQSMMEWSEGKVSGILAAPTYDETDKWLCRYVHPSFPYMLPSTLDQWMTRMSKSLRKSRKQH